VRVQMAQSSEFEHRNRILLVAANIRLSHVACACTRTYYEAADQDATLTYPEGWPG